MSAARCTQCGENQAPDARFCPRCGTATVADATDPLVGQVIADRYLLTDLIGQGTSGTIYRAEHTTLKRKMAVKILHHQLSRDEAAPKPGFRELASDPDTGRRPGDNSTVAPARRLSTAASACVGRERSLLDDGA